MPSFPFRHFSTLALGILASLGSLSPVDRPVASPQTCGTHSQNFLVMAGGGAPAYNEIALEKNVLYFQRTLETMGLDPAAAQIFFANGNDGEATVRYLNQARQQVFKAPEIPNLLGPSTLGNFQRWMEQTVQSDDRRPIFFYFTGHGHHNRSNADNNAMILWGEELFTVQEFAQMLDDLPQDMPMVTMMSQCYSGSFANFIYEGGDPTRPMALQTRCGFFATIKTRPSVGCTPEVNEADYRDYSSSFFAGLSGKSRTGQAVASADYNQDDRVSYAEAHAFAKVDGQTTDLPVSTVEVWLQNRAERSQVMNQPIASILATASPERRYVVESLMQKFRLDPKQSLNANVQNLAAYARDTEIEQAYLTRLSMELVNIATEKQIREGEDQEPIAILDRLTECEQGSWQSAQ
jgi:hypothetical protein